jgi:hypothetical protein
MFSEIQKTLENAVAMEDKNSLPPNDFLAFVPFVHGEKLDGKILQLP